MREWDIRNKRERDGDEDGGGRNANDDRYPWRNFEYKPRIRGRPVSIYSRVCSPWEKFCGLSALLD